MSLMNEALGAQSLNLTRHYYPDPFLDFASTVLPKSYQKLLELCRIFAMTHPQIGPIIRKYSRYPLTHVIVRSTKSPEIGRWWKDALTNTLNIVQFAESVGLDFFTYGSAYVTSSRPFRRVYECSSCHNYHDAEIAKIKYEIRDKKFWGKCQACSRFVRLIPHDEALHRIEGLRMVRLAPMEMQSKVNHVTAEVDHYSSPPAALKRAVRQTPLDYKLIDRTPLQFVLAAISNSKIEYAPGTVLHLFEPAPSGNDYHFGMPRIMPSLKTAYLDQLYRKSDESAALERTLPARWVFPQPTAANPFKTISLSQFTKFISMSLRRWRQDKNAVMTSPFPIGVAEVGNDGAQYNTAPMRQQAIKEIIGGMGAPEGILSDAMTWSGGSVQLRMMENDLQPYVNAINRLVNFGVSEIAAVTGRPKVDAAFKPFRTIDDVQTTQIIMNLAQQHQVSFKEVLDRLGLDYEGEHEQIRREITLKSDLTAMQMLGEVKAMQRQAAMQGTAQAGAQGHTTIDDEIRTQGDGLVAELQGHMSVEQFEQSQQQQDEQAAKQQARVADAETRIVENKARVGGAQADKLDAEAGKLKQHELFYSDQKEMRDDGQKAKLIDSYVGRLMKMDAPTAKRYLAELEQLSPELSTAVFEEYLLRVEDGQGRGQAQPAATGTLAALRESSSSPDELARRILMRGPDERTKLLDELVKTDPMIAAQVVRHIRAAMQGTSGGGGSGLMQVRPQPNVLPPRRTSA